MIYDLVNIVISSHVWSGTSHDWIFHLWLFLRLIWFPAMSHWKFGTSVWSFWIKAFWIWTFSNVHHTCISFRCIASWYFPWPSSISPRFLGETSVFNWTLMSWGLYFDVIESDCLDHCFNSGTTYRSVVLKLNPCNRVWHTLRLTVHKKKENIIGESFKLWF